MARLFLPLDIEYASDDEFIEAGPLAELLFIRASCFIKRKRQDGQLRHNQLPLISNGIKASRQHAAKLVEVGLWIDEGDHWFVPSYLKHNPSNAEIKASTDIAKEAGIKGNHERWHVGEDGKPNSKCPICVAERVANPIGTPIAPPIGGGNRVGSPTTETEPVPEPVPPPKPVPEPSKGRRLPTRSTGDDPTAAKTKAVIEHIVEHRCSTVEIAKPDSYKPKVRRDVTQAHTERIGELVARFPDAPVDVIAHGVETGDTRRLTHFEPAQPVVEPEGPKLSREERDALVEANRKPA